MTQLAKITRNRSVNHSVFGEVSLGHFAANYPETGHILSHELHTHPLLEFEALADFGERLGPDSVEYNRSDQPIAVDARPDPLTTPVRETIRNIGESGAWLVLRNIQQDPLYNQLLDDLLDQIAPEVEAKTGPMLSRAGFIMITSPGGVTPCHVDPEHNILLQIKGSKVMTQFGATDRAIADDTFFERYHMGGQREIPWSDAMKTNGTDLAIGPGQGLYVPYMAPHYVQNGNSPSISLSITWRSEWSYEEADARGFNAYARKAGLQPAAPHRWPRRNTGKALTRRVIRKLAG